MSDRHQVDIRYYDYHLGQYVNKRIILNHNPDWRRVEMRLLRHIERMTGDSISIWPVVS